MKITPMRESEKAAAIDDLVDIAAHLVVAIRDVGTDALDDVLARVPAGQEAAFALVLAAMVSPEQGIRSALSWTDTMVDARGRPRRERAEPPAERERQRLLHAGVPADTAILMAARDLAAEQAAGQDSIRARMLRVIHGERTA